MLNVVVASLLLFQVAAGDADWAALVSQASGTELRVRTEELTLRGDLVSADPTALRLKIQKDTDVTVSRSRVVKVERRVPGSNRARNASYGLAIGLGIGFLRYPLQCQQCDGSALPLLAGAPMMIGAITGATMAAERWEIVYERAKEHRP